MTTAKLKLEALKEAVAEKLMANGDSVAKAKSGTLEWRWRDGILTIRLSTEF